MMKVSKKRSILLIFVFLILGGGAYAFQIINSPRNNSFLTWFRGEQKAREALITHRDDVCPNAPFLLPAEGFIGLLYADPRGPYSLLHPHQGIDIFSDAEPGVIPVYAAFDGYITRESDWKSSLIQRVPKDPFDSSSQIWLYYTHMADLNGNDFIVDTFPQGIRELFVSKGELLGYTGNYSGNPNNPVGVHLHFSIIKDNGNGGYTNELEFENSIDPTPYLGVSVNYQTAPLELTEINCSALNTGMEN